MSETLMMRQYYRIKENYKDALLFFRLGDFYELFNEDAKIASQELGILLRGTRSIPWQEYPIIRHILT